MRLPETGHAHEHARLKTVDLVSQTRNTEQNTYKAESSIFHLPNYWVRAVF